ncbi:GNAT family N-acetyltransferase [Paracoccus sp. (in: a-proteobacteria)]|uniref:GNAT family N-acetyltransferase n=1 Tax=Paracoccus sp. TaxID=267 RepID=UPI003A83C5F4
MQISDPIPAHILPEAAGLWCAAFADRRAARRARASHGIAAMRAGRVAGVAGLRDETGGFLAEGRSVVGLLYRAAPPTADLVIDGIVVRDRRLGVGRALVEAAEQAARTRGRGGLRAEVRLKNRGALAFYRQLGFHEETRGRFGWPWSGVVVVLRKPLGAP